MMIFIFSWPHFRIYLDEIRNPRHGDMTDNIKVGILNRALPENLRWINVFQFSGCYSYVKRLIPDIAFSDIKERKIQEQNPKNYF